MRRLHISIIAATLLAITPTLAQTTLLPLSLEECRAMAIEHNLNLKSSIEKIASAEDIAKAYRSNHLPNISAGASYLYSTAGFTETIEGGFLPTYVLDQTTGGLIPNVASVGADGTPIFNEYAYMPDQSFDFEVSSIVMANIKLLQPIYMGGKISNATKLSLLGVEFAQSERRLSRSEVITECDKAFYSYLKVEDMIKSTNRYRTVVEELMRQTESASRNGMCTTSDVMKVQVKLTEAELMQRKAENGLLLARMNLCYMIGLPLTTPSIALQDDFDLSISIDNEDLDITSRPEYEMLQLQIEAKRLEMKITKSEFLPSIVAMAAGGYGYGAKINDVVLLNQPTFAGGIMVNIPIFHWGEGRRKVSSSRRQVTIAENTLEDMSQRMTLELMQAINSYDESLLEVEFAIRSVAEAEESMRLSHTQYLSGMETVADYLEAQALWQQAMSKLTDAKATQRLAYTNYRRCVGME